MKPDTVASLQRWWELRLDQKIEECHVEFARLKLKAGFGEGYAIEALEFDSDRRFELHAELHLMEASLWRAEGQAAKADLKIKKVEQAFRTAGIRPSFQIYLQRGITLLLASDYSGALEQFLAARTAGRTGLERAWALTNTLFCLEYLGLPFAKTRGDLEGELLAIALPAGIRDQVQAFDLRNAFRKGELKPFSEALAIPENGRLSQPFYYRLWVGSLPFLSAPKMSVTSELLETFVCSDRWFHLRSYRSRTLQGIIHPDDLESFKATELADRLYLWTWRWLTQPETFPFERLAPLLKLLDPPQLGRRLSSEDFQMIRNCLLWFSLFDGGSSKDLAETFAFLKPNQEVDYPIFDFERGMIELCEFVRDGRESEVRQRLIYLQSHPLWNAPGVGFRALIEAVMISGGPAVPEKLQGLLSSFAHWLKRPKNTRGEVVQFDLVTYEIRKKGAPSLISPPICKAFQLLAERRTVTLPEFTQFCFGFHRFDPVIHDGKVFNLLSRMRVIAPNGMRIGVKAGSVFCAAEAKVWRTLSFERRHPLASPLQESEEWRHFQSRPTAGPKPAATDDRFLRPGLILRQMAGRGEISRLELEKIIGKSRATSHRLITRWLERGYLKKKGKARSTRYLIVKVTEKP